MNFPTLRNWFVIHFWVNGRFIFPLFLALGLGLVFWGWQNGSPLTAGSDSQVTLAQGILAEAKTVSNSNAIAAPTLKWSYGGCYNSWCETGWYSSPAVADLNGDGQMVVLGGGYTLFALDGKTGAITWQAAPPSSGARIWPGVVVADLNGNGNLEIVTAHGGGYLRVLDNSGALLWQRRPATNELRGLAVHDLDGDGTLEIVVTGAVYSRVNTWVYEHDGALRSGWPQLNNDSGYAYGVFNDNAAIGDLDSDGAGLELVVPSDVHYINAYKPDGAQIPANPMYGDRGWGRVGVWESPEIELRGWGDCSTTRAERYRTNFAHGAAVIADLNGDGVNELVVTGNVYDCAIGHPPGRYNGLYIFNADRSRFNAGGFDWRTLPVDTGAPLSEDYNVIENNQPNPVVADLDGDGIREIIYSSYDGRVHAFWLDKTERHNWPYLVHTGGPFRFASEPVIADLNNDGKAEVIFTSWPQKGLNLTGKLHILDYRGNVIHEIDLPSARSGNWNGGLAAPTLANIDDDPDLELVVLTAHSGLVAYDLPGTAEARILWGTGRGNYQRTGSLLQGSLELSRKWAVPVMPLPGETVTFTVALRNNGPELPTVTLTDTLPAGLAYGGYAWASAGNVVVNGNTITWAGAVAPGAPVTVRFTALVDAGLVTPQVMVNRVSIEDGNGRVLVREAMIVVGGTAVYLPVVSRP